MHTHMMHTNRRTIVDKLDPAAVLAEVRERAEARIPAIADRLALILAKTTDPRICKLFISAEIKRLIAELAVGLPEPARRGLLGLDLGPLDACDARDGREA